MGCLLGKPLFGKYYNLGEKVGSGHFADVYTCFQKSDGKKFAVKIINKKHLVNKELLEDEVEILRKVGHHKNILQLIDTFDSTEEYFIVTEFCAGGDLFSRIVEMGSINEKLTINLMKQLTEAIHHVHSCGVTHRDLKPENILLLTNDKNSILKVADFGLSKIRQDGDVIMKTVCGTWAYCAPEVIKRTHYTHRVDNWTLGILLFVILAGYHPFDMYGDAPEAELMKRIERVEYDFDDEVWEEISQHAQDIIKQLLVKDPMKRMTTGDLLKTDWINGKCEVNSKTNEKAMKNLQRLVNIRKKMKVTFLTTKMVSKFKSKLKKNQSMRSPDAQKKQAAVPPVKEAWANVLP